MVSKFNICNYEEVKINMFLYVLFLSSLVS